MAKRPRKTYTEAQRQEILAAAQKEGLTALQIQKKFGVTPVTYYSWRKKKGLKGPRGRRPGTATPDGDLGAQVRAGVQSRVREILPGRVREEVAGYLDALFGRGGKVAKRRAPRKKK
jgi:transposase-like protein